MSKTNTDSASANEYLVLNTGEFHHAKKKYHILKNIVICKTDLVCLSRCESI